MELMLDVLFVPCIDQNLLSVGQLLEDGFRVRFEDRSCTVRDKGGRVVLNVKMRGKSFTLEPEEDVQAAVHAQEGSIALWHKRLGYYPHKALLKTKNKGIARELLELEEDSPQCITRQDGKQSRKAILEQQKADENLLKLAEDQRREKEDFRRRIIDLEYKLDQKHALELEIELLKGAKEVIKHISEEGDKEAVELCRMLVDNDEADWKKKKKVKVVGEQVELSSDSRLKLGSENVEQIQQPKNVVKQNVQLTGPSLSKKNVARKREKTKRKKGKETLGNGAAEKHNDKKKTGVCPNKAKEENVE